MNERRDISEESLSLYDMKLLIYKESVYEIMYFEI